MSNPTYSGYLSWITITSLLSGCVVWGIIIIVFTIADDLIPYGFKELDNIFFIISYWVITIIVWILIFKNRSYEDYLKNE